MTKSVRSPPASTTGVNRTTTGPGTTTTFAESADRASSHAAASSISKTQNEVRLMGGIVQNSMRAESWGTDMFAKDTG
jgi:hypothetical protein